MSEPVVLSYHDSVIHESECELLQGPHWLNDTLIQFHLDYLEHAAFPAADVAFVGPDVAQFARLCPAGDLTSFLEPLRLPSRRGALIVVNDCERADAPGGTHWSLLVFAAGKFIHYDSLSDGNQSVARHMARRLAPHLSASAKVEEAVCGRQQNGYDCGVFVIVHAEEVARRLSQGGESLRNVPVSQQRVDAKRKEMLQLIYTLAGKPAAV